jgi:hypothetical protein
VPNRQSCVPEFNQVNFVQVKLLIPSIIMAKFSFAILAALAASASAFVSPKVSSAKSSALQASKAEVWDPLGLYELGSGEAFDTFPNVFPDKQFLEAAEIKHGRQAMLAWTGVWATAQVCKRTVRLVGYR